MGIVIISQLVFNTRHFNANLPQTLGSTLADGCFGNGLDIEVHWSAVNGGNRGVLYIFAAGECIHHQRRIRMKRCFRLTRQGWHCCRRRRSVSIKTPPENCQGRRPLTNFQRYLHQSTKERQSVLEFLKSRTAGTYGSTNGVAAQPNRYIAILCCKADRSEGLCSSGCTGFLNVVAALDATGIALAGRHRGRSRDGKESGDDKDGFGEHG